MICLICFHNIIMVDHRHHTHDPKEASDKGLLVFVIINAGLIAALINLTTLVLIGLYLIFEAVWRFFQPVFIESWIVIFVAGAALLVDIITAFLTWRLARISINVRAAFMHNSSDAMASVAVMLAGILILLYRWYWIDSLLTLVIAGLVLYQGLIMLPRTIHILMRAHQPTFP